MARRQSTTINSRSKVRTVCPVPVERKQKATAQIADSGRAHQGYSKAKAERLLERVAAISGLSVARLRAQLIPPSSWNRAGQDLGPRAAQTMARVSRTLARAEHVWESQSDAAKWLSRPHQELDGATPYSMLKTEEGALAVEALLSALDSGVGV